MSENLSNCQKQKRHIGGFLDGNKPLRLYEVMYRDWPTFYTPPKDQEPKLPNNLHGIKPSGNLSESIPSRDAKNQVLMMTESTSIYGAETKMESTIIFIMKIKGSIL